MDSVIRQFNTPQQISQTPTPSHLTVKFGDYIRDSWHKKGFRHARTHVELVPETENPSLSINLKKEQLKRLVDQASKVLAQLPNLIREQTSSESLEAGEHKLKEVFATATACQRLLLQAVEEAHKRVAEKQAVEKQAADISAATDEIGSKSSRILRVIAEGDPERPLSTGKCRLAKLLQLSIETSIPEQNQQQKKAVKGYQSLAINISQSTSTNNQKDQEKTLPLDKSSKLQQQKTTKSFTKALNSTAGEGQRSEQRARPTVQIKDSNFNLSGRK